MNSLALLTTTPDVVPLEGQKVRRHVLIKHEKSEFAGVFYFLFCGGVTFQIVTKDGLRQWMRKVLV